jgi:hypothetical protein
MNRRAYFLICVERVNDNDVDRDYNGDDGESIKMNNQSKIFM